MITGLCCIVSARPMYSVSLRWLLTLSQRAFRDGFSDGSPSGCRSLRYGPMGGSTFPCLSCDGSESAAEYVLHPKPECM